MRKLLSLAIPACIALVTVVISGKQKAHAQNVACKKATQACYEVYVRGIKVQSKSGVAQIRL